MKLASLSTGGFGTNNQRTFTLAVLSTDAFVTTWQTTATDEAIVLPISGEGFSVTIDWGDGSTAQATTTANPSHTYASAGTHSVVVTGTFDRIHLNDNNASNPANDRKLIALTQWGTTVWSTMQTAFQNAANLATMPTTAGVPDLSMVTDRSFMFVNTSKFNGDIGNWNVSSIQTMESMFSAASIFNKYIGNWDVSNVTNMDSMFVLNRAFNQDIGNWDVSAVTNMDSMFQSARGFNKNIGNWDVSMVTSMNNMFQDADIFNQDISNWNVSKVGSMANMFLRAGAFNQNLGEWYIVPQGTFSGNSTGQTINIRALNAGLNTDFIGHTPAPTYSLSGTGADNGKFNLTTAGLLTLVTPTPSATSYEISIASANGFGEANTETLTLSLNEAPVITGGVTATVSVAEGQTAVTTVVATDVDAGKHQLSQQL